MPLFYVLSIDYTTGWQRSRIQSIIFLFSSHACDNRTSSRFTVFHISGFGCDKFLMGVTSNVIAIKSQAKLNRERSESIWFLSGSNPIRKSGGNDWKSVCSCMFSTTRPHNRFFIESTKANEDIPFGKCFFVKN